MGRLGVLIKAKLKLREKLSPRAFTSSPRPELHDALALQPIVCDSARPAEAAAAAGYGADSSDINNMNTAPNTRRSIGVTPPPELIVTSHSAEPAYLVETTASPTHPLNMRRSIDSASPMYTSVRSPARSPVRSSVLADISGDNSRGVSPRVKRRSSFPPSEEASGTDGSDAALGGSGVSKRPKSFSVVEEQKENAPVVAMITTSLQPTETAPAAEPVQRKTLSLTGATEDSEDDNNLMELSLDARLKLENEEADDAEPLMRDAAAFKLSSTGFCSSSAESTEDWGMPPSTPDAVPDVGRSPASCKFLAPTAVSKEQAEADNAASPPVLGLAVTGSSGHLIRFRSMASWATRSKARDRWQLCHRVLLLLFWQRLGHSALGRWRAGLSQEELQTLGWLYKSGELYPDDDTQKHRECVVAATEAERLREGEAERLTEQDRHQESAGEVECEATAEEEAPAPTTMHYVPYVGDL